MFPQIQHDSNWLHLHHFSFLVLSPAIKFSPISTLTVPALVLILLDCSAKSLQSCPTLCDPIDSSPLGSSVPRILQARTLEWVAIAFSNAWKWKVKVKSLSLVQLFATPWTATYQAPASMGFSRQEYWSGVPFLFPSNWECDIQIQCSEKGDRVWSLMTPWIVYFCKSLMWEKKYLHV